MAMSLKEQIDQLRARIVTVEMKIESLKIEISGINSFEFEKRLQTIEEELDLDEEDDWSN